MHVLRRRIPDDERYFLLLKRFVETPGGVYSQIVLQDFENKGPAYGKRFMQSVSHRRGFFRFTFFLQLRPIPKSFLTIGIRKTGHLITEIFIRHLASFTAVSICNYRDIRHPMSFLFAVFSIRELFLFLRIKQYNCRDGFSVFHRFRHVSKYRNLLLSYECIWYTCTFRDFRQTL